MWWEWERRIFSSLLFLWLLLNDIHLCIVVYIFSLYFLLLKWSSCPKDKNFLITTRRLCNGMSLCLSAVAAGRRTILHTRVMIIVIIASHTAACQEYNGFAYLSAGSNVALVSKRWGLPSPIWHEEKIHEKVESNNLRSKRQPNALKSVCRHN